MYDFRNEIYEGHEEDEAAPAVSHSTQLLEDIKRKEKQEKHDEK